MSFSVVDAILIPTPFYGVITEDVHLYSDVKLFHVPLDCEVGKRICFHSVILNLKYSISSCLLTLACTGGCLIQLCFLFCLLLITFIIIA